jgi:hypothetical protein
LFLFCSWPWVLIELPFKGCQSQGRTNGSSIMLTVSYLVCKQISGVIDPSSKWLAVSLTPLTFFFPF